MNADRTGKSATLLTVFAAILLLSWIGSPAPGWPLVALPADIGIDYRTMKVTQADKLIAAGMKNVQNGDSVTLRAAPREGKILIRNVRTGEELLYPSGKQKGK